MSYLEQVLLQGYLQYSATTESQSILTQGFFVSTIPASSIPTSIFDIIYNPQQNIGDKYPKWMDYYYNTDETSGSLLRRFFIGYSQGILDYKYFQNNVINYSLWDPWLGELSHGWVSSSQLEAKDIYNIVVTNEFFSTVPRKCSSFNQFLGAIGPSYIVSDDGFIYFRDLDQSTISVEITGSVELSTDLLSGRDVYWTEDYITWNIIQSNSTDINYTTGTITIPATGTVGIVYSSSEIFESHRNSVVYVNKNSSISISIFDYWNSIDELGLIFDIQRSPEEDNYNYYNRIKMNGVAKGSCTKQGLLRSTGRYFLDIKSGYWNGINTINIPASSKVNTLWIKDQYQYRYLSHDTLKKNSDWFTPSKGEWSDLHIFNDNYLVSTYTTSGGKIFFDSISNQVEASYKYKFYNTEYTDENITQISSTKNTPQHVYFLSWISSGNVYTLNSEEYKDLRLLDGVGNPTINFLEIYEKIRGYVIYNYTNWGSSPWYLDEDLMPQVDYLPLVMD